jgi:16S rRNA (cytidine1402-2'-O)-methyltransferase
MMNSQVYLIPCPIAEDALDTLPSSILQAVKKCNVFFVEDERSARRFLKKIWKEMVIDDYQWFLIQSKESKMQFTEAVRQHKQIGIISEAGCPGVADPGQDLIALAQELQVIVQPLVGPSSILLALMASGMNGQHFSFLGYLPIDTGKRIKALRELEAVSVKERATQIFIETPYRNNPMLQSILNTCQPRTRLCIAVDITGKDESIRTMTVSDWKKQVPELHKKTVIFLVAGAG